MQLYKKLIRPLLFSMDPETAHSTVSIISGASIHLPFSKKIIQKTYRYTSDRLKINVSGIDFPNPVGLGAGFDKTGKLYPFLSIAGFGFIECGTFTALKQPGNPCPRIFRFPEHQALVNRMGFNNPGAEEALHNIKNQRTPVPRGINLGKSKLTPLDEAVEDYLTSLRLLLPYADYITVNVSSPNTPNLRLLQEAKSIQDLLTSLQKEIQTFKTDRKIPLFVKLAPDLSQEHFTEILDVLLDIKLDGLILTNTSLDKNILGNSSAIEGGLSGRPVFHKSTEMIRRAFVHTEGKIPIIGVGGIFSGEDALEKIKAGASLIQIYTGYIYEGPFLPAEISKTIDQYLNLNNTSLVRLIGSSN